jgi:endonuclease YncB( thermonuclease family)
MGGPEGQILAYVELEDGTDCGAELVKAGWAIAYKAMYLCERSELYIQLESEAKSNKRGFWYK